MVFKFIYSLFFLYYIHGKQKKNVFFRNYDGSQIAITGKDKKLRLLDPRNPDEAASVPSFDGGKSSKVFWVPNLGWIGATGFSKSARRQLKFWDLKVFSLYIFFFLDYIHGIK